MITIAGGIISNQNGCSVTYKLKCEVCGSIESDNTTITLTRGVTEITTKRCLNCGNNQLIKMKFAEVDKVRSF